MIGIAAAVGFQTDALVIASRLGVESVPEYAAPYRLFSLVTGVVTLFALPLSGPRTLTPSPATSTTGRAARFDGR